MEHKEIRYNKIKLFGGCVVHPPFINPKTKNKFGMYTIKTLKF